MAGNGSSARLKISRIKNINNPEDSPGDFHVGGCMRRPKDVLYEESHLDEDGEGTDEADEKGAVGLIPNAEAHFSL